ncbi:hypothetical protein BC832DRAFT_549013 [Gaertneriomyces semiglobifer]|nr:hypothetical protein BC832DRAFT_549013 [Gaertneriomyces semiglobifer]
MLPPFAACETPFVYNDRLGNILYQISKEKERIRKAELELKDANEKLVEMENMVKQEVEAGTVRATACSFSDQLKDGMPLTSAPTSTAAITEPPIYSTTAPAVSHMYADLSKSFATTMASSAPTQAVGQHATWVQRQPSQTESEWPALDMSFMDALTAPDAGPVSSMAAMPGFVSRPPSSVWTYPPATTMNTSHAMPSQASQPLESTQAMPDFYSSLAFGETSLLPLDYDYSDPNLAFTENPGALLVHSPLDESISSADLNSLLGFGHFEESGEGGVLEKMFGEPPVSVGMNVTTNSPESISATLSMPPSARYAAPSFTPPGEAGAEEPPLHPLRLEKRYPTPKNEKATASECSTCAPSANFPTPAPSNPPSKRGSGTLSTSTRPARAHKITREETASCSSCKTVVATLLLHGDAKSFEVAHEMQMTCRNCTTPEVLSAATANSSARKRKVGSDGIAALVYCDVCKRYIGVGAMKLLSLCPNKSHASGSGSSSDSPYAHPRMSLPFDVEVICSPCYNKYSFCSECGGGGTYRTGKWRPKELFLPGRKTCSLSHERVGPIANGPKASGASPYTYEVTTPDRISPGLAAHLTDLYVSFSLKILATPKIMESRVGVNTWKLIEERRKTQRKEMETLLISPPPYGFKRFLAIAWMEGRRARKKKGSTSSNNASGLADPEAPEKIVAAFITCEYDYYHGNLLDSHGLATDQSIKGPIPALLCCILERVLEESRIPYPNIPLVELKVVWTIGRKRCVSDSQDGKSPSNGTTPPEAAIDPLARRLGYRTLDEYRQRVLGSSGSKSDLPDESWFRTNLFDDSLLGQVTYFVVDFAELYKRVRGLFGSNKAAE